MKKVLSLLLATAMAVGSSVVAFAEDRNVTNQTELETAISAAADGDTIILASGTYKLPGFSKTLTIKAADGADVTIDNGGAVALSGATVVFEDITFDYYPNVNYTGLQHTTSLTYNDCTINGQVFLYAAEETFNDCTFNQNSSNAYNVWTYGADEVDFNNCTFNSAGKSVLIYNEGAGPTDASFNDCDFFASQPVEGKAAIEIDATLLKDGEDHKITVDNGSVTGFANGSVSGNPIWNKKQGADDAAIVVVDGVENGSSFAQPDAPEEDTIVVEEEEEEEEFVSVTAKILWEGKAVSDGVEVKLLKNDKKYETKTLTAGKYRINNWRYTWSELDPEDDWTIEVIVPDGYECDIDEYGDNDFEITLTQVKVSATDAVEELNPNTGAI